MFLALISEVKTGVRRLQIKVMYGQYGTGVDYALVL